MCGLIVAAWCVAGEWARAALLGTVLVAAGVLALLPFDAAAKAWVVRHSAASPDLLAFARQVSHWGELHLGPLAAVVALWLGGRFAHDTRRGLAAVAGLLAMLTAGLLTDVIKWLVGRPRPYVTDAVDGIHWFHGSASFASFPSGHATHCAALVAAVAMLTGARVTLSLAAGAALVMWSRYFVGAHYPTDLLAGAWLGTAVGFAFGLGARQWLATQGEEKPTDDGRSAVDKPQNIAPPPPSVNLESSEVNSATASVGSTRWTKFAPWLLTATVLLLLLPGTATLPLLDRDEPRFATATREMMERHDWIVPTFNGEDRFDKPALTYWLMRAGYALLGVGETGARLPAMLSALALVLLTWRTGRRWFGESTGLLAGFALATCLQVLIHGRLAVADMPMVACVALVQVGLVELLTAAEGVAVRGWWWATWLVLGLGLLAKGPIVLAVPALSLLLFRGVLWRRPLPWARLGAGRGLLVALLLLAAWGVPALVVTHGRFWQVGIGEHVVQRGLEQFNGRGYTPWFYLGTAAVSLFPWIVFAGAAWAGARRNWCERTAWLVAWLAAPYLIFTCYATQLPHYVLPAFPAFFLLLSLGAGTLAPWARRFGETLLAVVAGLALVGGALVLASAADLPAGAEPLAEMFAGALMLVFALATLACAALRRHWPVLVAALLGAGGGTFFLAEGMRAANLAVNASAGWRDLPATTRFIGYGFGEPSLVFYSGRHWTMTDTPEALTAELAKPGPLVVLALIQEADPLKFFIGELHWSKAPHPPTLPLGHETEHTGFNPGRTRWQVVREWRRE